MTQTRRGKDKSLKDEVMLKGRNPDMVREGALGEASRPQVLDQRHRV